MLVDLNLRCAPVFGPSLPSLNLLFRMVWAPFAALPHPNADWFWFAMPVFGCGSLCSFFWIGDVLFGSTIVAVALSQTPPQPEVQQVQLRSPVFVSGLFSLNILGAQSSGINFTDSAEGGLPPPLPPVNFTSPATTQVALRCRCLTSFAQGWSWSLFPCSCLNPAHGTGVFFWSAY